MLNISTVLFSLASATLQDSLKATATQMMCVLSSEGEVQAVACNKKYLLDVAFENDELAPLFEGYDVIGEGSLSDPGCADVSSDNVIEYIGEPISLTALSAELCGFTSTSVSTSAPLSVQLAFVVEGTGAFTDVSVFSQNNTGITFSGTVFSAGGFSINIDSADGTAWILDTTNGLADTKSTAKGLANDGKTYVGLADLDWFIKDKIEPSTLDQLADEDAGEEYCNSMLVVTKVDDCGTVELYRGSGAAKWVQLSDNTLVWVDDYVAGALVNGTEVTLAEFAASKRTDGGGSGGASNTNTEDSGSSNTWMGWVFGILIGLAVGAGAGFFLGQKKGSKNPVTV